MSVELKSYIKSLCVFFLLFLIIWAAKWLIGDESPVQTGTVALSLAMYALIKIYQRT